MASLSRPPPSSRRIEWNLLENGIDFVRSSVELFFAAGVPFADGPIGVRQPSAGRPDHAFKYAILHLHAGCALLLKERLRREHPALIHKSVDGVDPNKHKTVDFDQALSRLQRWSDYELPESSRKTLRKLQTKRNRLEHFKVELYRQEAERLISAGVEFAYTFLRDELGVLLEDEISREAWHHVSALREVAKRIEQERRARWDSLARHYQEAPVSELEALEQGYCDPSDPDDGLEAQECDACGDTTLFLEPSGEAFVCTNPACRELSPVGSCVRCGTLTCGEGMCEDCVGYMHYVMEKD